MNTPRKHSLDAATIEQLARAVQRVLSGRPDVAAAYLYGSAARGEPAADLDVALLLHGEIEAKDLAALAALLQAEGAPHGPELDVRPLRGASPRFRANVLRDGRLLYEADHKARLDFEARTLSEWLDFRPTWERMRRRMFERWMHG